MKYKKFTVKEKAKLLETVAGMRRRGGTFRFIGEMLGISESRANAFYWESQHALKGRDVAWLKGTGTQVFNGIVALGIKSKDELSQAYNSGRIMRCYGYGLRFENEVRELLGLAAKKHKAKAKYFCPFCKKELRLGQLLKKK